MDMLTDMLGQKKITLVSGNAVDEKNLHRSGCKLLFLNQFS